MSYAMSVHRIARILISGSALLAAASCQAPSAAPARVARETSTTMSATTQPATTPATTTAATTRPAPSRTPLSAVTGVPRNPGRHAEFLYRIQQGPVGLLFVGDSITDYWPRRGEFSWLKFAPYTPADFGVSAERTEHVLWRLQNGELDGIAPKVIVLMIGTNNVGQQPPDKPEWAAAGVTEIVRLIHEKLPQTKVLLLGVFPRDVNDSRPRRDTIQINETIRHLDDGDKTRYLDIGQVFLDASGEIPPDVMPDKLHPNSKGYDLWYAAMKPLLDEMMK